MKDDKIRDFVELSEDELDEFAYSHAVLDDDFNYEQIDDIDNDF